ncbi:hypothetical protein KIW84_041389 [Lathyrus oleraceus]|uniref:Aminotransferase-like plant mobile domain-containing protein n=1 Tax=Pisum sativum TaxID=3888 RepID=A0A9D5AS00_PEA|nr:hypothetical protein KIW84_041389 [Pisum sativum]
MHTRKIYVSRDVQFFETMFPYHDLQTPSIANDISINTQILDCEFDDSSSNLSPASSISPGISHHDDTIVPILTPQDDNSSNIPSNIPSIPVETPQQHSPTAINPAERRYPQRLRTPSVRLTDHDRYPLKFINHRQKITDLPQPNEDWFKAALSLSGMKDLCMINYTTVNHWILNAFVEKWHTETLSFHLPLSEMSITLDDVSYLLHLSIRGNF